MKRDLCHKFKTTENRNNAKRPPILANAVNKEVEGFLTMSYTWGTIIIYTYMAYLFLPISKIIFESSIWYETVIVSSYLSPKLPKSEKPQMLSVKRTLLIYTLIIFILYGVS